MDIIKLNFLFILVISLFGILLGHDSNWASFLGKWGDTAPDPLEGLYTTLVFLVALMFYGFVMGIMKNRGFIKFISLYWGIGGTIGLIAVLMAPIGMFVIIALPVEILTIVPANGLSYFYPANMSRNTLYLVQPIVSMISSWSASAIGYLIGYLLKKLKVTRSGINA